ncbi:MAG: pentapeptide repeat-containing protein [Bacteroidales bacterium]|nr:pentapeptide repeat-containing protein [Bacteroidales bacterium]
MDREELLKLIETKKIVGIDLSGEKLEKIDFSGCTLERVNFKGCEMVHCRFRNAKIMWSDFRYAEIQHGTFEGAQIDFCDFYRAFIDGVVIFNGSMFSNCSLNKTYLGDCAIIRRENLKDFRILQQNKEEYTRFLVDWHTYGTGERTNDVNVKSDWNPQAAVDARWADAEVIYKNFNALWTGKGYIADGNWAYVQGKRMERMRLISDFKFANIVKISTNFLSDILFGYGESMTKMILTYILTVFLFAWAFTENVSLLEYSQAFAISLKNMVGMDSELLQDVSPLVDMLNVVQTTIGILLTGIFGFILGNKIRNQ